MSSVTLDVRDRLLAGMPLDERRLTLAGIETAVLEGGHGHPMVLLHGPGEHAAKWLRVVPDLVRTHRVVAPDLPAHGATDIPRGEGAFESVLAWLDALIAQTCPEPPILVGQIIGGAIAARFAARHSDAISHLVLVDALGLAPLQPTPEFGAALTAFLSGPSEETHDRLWHQCAHDLDALRVDMGERWFDLRAYNLDRAHAEGLLSAQGGLMEAFGFPAIPEAELARIEAPTTLIWGREDLATDPSVAEAASARYEWPLHLIDGAADDPPLERPKAFLRTLRLALGRAGS